MRKHSIFDDKEKKRRYIPVRMAKSPLIIVSPSIEKRGIEFHDLSVSLSVKYENAVLQAGGIPVTTPTTNDRKSLAEVVRRADGVLLTGGDDINPDLYDRHLPRAVRQTIDTTPDGGGRDWRELVLIDEAFRQHKPLLAIAGASIVKHRAGWPVDCRHPAPGARGIEPSTHGPGGRISA